MPKIGLILAGAVSLGSYEGGVLEELLYLLERLNRDSEGEPYLLDVITGASAGAMTAALVARATLNNPRHRRALHDAWVDDIDIVDLLQGTPRNSLLSKEPIDRIADRYLELDEEGEDQPASYAPEILRMAFTLSNLNGVDYSLPIRHAQGQQFTSTFFIDGRHLRLSHQNARDPREWTRVREAAIASGNFPFAFSPAEVSTNEDAYPGHSLPELPDPFHFVDGGMFNNEPVREAVRLASEADGGAIDPNRIFLLVDANLNGSTHDASIDADLSLPATAMRLLKMLRGESSGNDWLRAQRVNNQIDWRDAFIGELRSMVEDNELAQPEVFIRQLNGVGEGIAERKRALFGESRYPATYLQDAMERTRRQHRDLLDGLSPGRQEILASLVFLLNSISGLDKKSQLNLEIIYADPEKVAGDPLASFGGFFDRAWREHDYRLGRRTANQLLPTILGIPPYEREAGVEYEADADLSDATMKDISGDVRRKARNVLLRKLESVVKPKLGGGMKAWAAWTWGIKGKVKKELNKVLEL